MLAKPFFVKHLFAIHQHTIEPSRAISAKSQLFPMCGMIHFMEISRETLVAALRERGVGYLAPSDALATENAPSDGTLLAALLQQSDSRLKLAMIPLLLRHPRLADNVSDLARQTDSGVTLELQILYMAAVYLQRLWKTRLSFYVDTSTLLPDLYSQEMGLPSAEERFGKHGLYDLADVWKERSRYPFDRLAALNTTMDLFFEQLKLEEKANDRAPTR